MIKQRKIISMIIILGFILLVGAGAGMRLMHDVPFVKGDDVYSIGLYRFNTLDELTNDTKKKFAKIFSPNDVTDVDALYVADPFLLRHDDLWYLFFEILLKDTKKGVIGYATSKDLYQWSYGSVVLDEPFHLSYPEIFTYEGDVYMIPESCRANGVRLYKAAHFPRSWKYVKTLVVGNIVDPSIIEYNGMWWMFSETNPRGNDQLSIFYANGLFDTWYSHEKNPILYQDPHFARPGGRMKYIDGSLYRFPQDDSPRYGLMIHGFRIDTLTPSEYSETRMGSGPLLEGTGNILNWNGQGMHQIDIEEVNDGVSRFVAVVDGWTTRYSFSLEKNKK